MHAGQDVQLHKHGCPHFHYNHLALSLERAFKSAREMAGVCVSAQREPSWPEHSEHLDMASGGQWGIELTVLLLSYVYRDTFSCAPCLLARCDS